MQYTALEAMLTCYGQSWSSPAGRTGHHDSTQANNKAHLSLSLVTRSSVTRAHLLYTVGFIPNRAYRWACAGLWPLRYIVLYTARQKKRFHCCACQPVRNSGRACAGDWQQYNTNC
jgi:hypothetical protein